MEFFHKYFRNENISLIDDSKISKEFFEESLCSFELADTNGSLCEISDWSIDTRRNKIITLGRDRVIRYYNINKPAIKRFSLIEESKDVEIVLETNKRFYNLGEEIILNISLERPKGPIAEFCIIKGTNADQNVEFLNENYAWQEGIHLFEGNSFMNGFENIKPALFVRDVFESYDQINYYVCSFREKMGGVSEENFISIVNSKIIQDAKTVHSNKTSIICAKKNAESEIDVTSLVSSDDANISLQGLSNLIFVKDGNDFFSLEEEREGAYFSETQEAIYLEKSYEGVLNLRIEYTDNSDYESELSYEHR